MGGVQVMGLFLGVSTHGNPPGLLRFGPVFGVAASPRVSACAIDQGAEPFGPPDRLVGSGMIVCNHGYLANKSVRHADGAAADGW